MQLRDYQKKAITELKNSITKGNNKIILTLATGAGKSVIAREIVKMAGMKDNFVLYTAHRTILIKQMRETFKGLDNVVCETLQTSKNREYDDVKIIIFDEMHYGVNSAMQDVVLAKYSNAIVIGLSATPIMHNGSKIDGWDDVIDIVQLCDLIEWGYASKVKVLSAVDVDTSKLRTSGNDFNSKDINEEVNKSEVMSNVIEQFEKYAKNLKTIFYCVNISHAENLCSILKSKGYNVSEYHSKMKNKEEIFDNFKDNKIQILCSVESLTTGVDLPDIYCLVLATPTKSVIKAVQIYGRATRLNYKDKNKEALILDCANVVKSTIHPLERLDFTKEVKNKFKKCGCGGTLKLIKREVSTISELGEYKETSTFICCKCGDVDIREEDKVLELKSCEKCGEIIKSGTATTETVFKEDCIEITSKCPHCGNETVLRSLKQAEKQMIELKFENIQSWDEIKNELRQARGKDGKKYHYKWSDIVVENLKDENFKIEEVKNFIRYYKSKGWYIGGIVNAMVKRRNK